MTIRLAYNTNGFAHHRLDDCLRILADLGYQGVSLTLDVHHLDPFRVTPRGLDDLRAILDRLGLERTIETGGRYLLDPWRKHHPSLVSAEGAGRRLRFLERAIEIAADLGAPVVTFSSGAPDEALDPERQWRELAERCAGLASLAGRKGIALGFEPEPGMLVADLAGFRRLASEVGHESFGLTLDVGHVHLVEQGGGMGGGGGGIARHIEEWGPRLRHVHLEDMRRPEHRHLAIGEGDIPFAGVLGALRSQGYAGLVALELSRDSHRAPEVAREAIRRLRGHIG